MTINPVNRGTLVARHLSKSYRGRQVVHDVSFGVRAGEAVGILGPNGAGKTTCFYMVTGLVPVDSGAIEIDGFDVTALPMYRRARLGVGYLPQEASIFRGLSVENNIKAVLEVVEKDRHKRERQLDALLDEFKIAHLRKSAAISLSGGERRRLEIARALASRPSFMLLDEPFAGIDPIAIADIQQLVRQLTRHGIGVLITDHNVRETLGLVDRAYIIHAGQVLTHGRPNDIVANGEAFCSIDNLVAVTEPVLSAIENRENGGTMAHSFGFRKVAAGEKQPLVNEVFHSVAAKYDLMNDLMSAGLHRRWKGDFVAMMAPPHRQGWHLLDVAGGTGDIAFRAVAASRHQARATILDINASMLEVGRQRAAKKKLDAYCDFVEANAEQLPFENNRFDAYSIAFGIRNVPDIARALKEAYRVLKPGGRFLCLEFSDVEMPFLDRIYDLWSFHAIPRLGGMVTGDEDSYRYLVESIRKFPNQPRFAAMIEQAGFARVGWRNLSGGIVAIHSGWKI